MQLYGKNTYLEEYDGRLTKDASSFGQTNLQRCRFSLWFQQQVSENVLGSDERLMDDDYLSGKSKASPPLTAGLFLYHPRGYIETVTLHHGPVADVHADLLILEPLSTD